MLVVSDLDGTLTFDGRCPHPALVERLHRLVASGDVRLVLATSRSPRCLRAWFADLAQRIDLVCCNGALHLPPGDLPATVRPLPTRSAGRLVRRLTLLGVGWTAEYGDHFIAPDRHVLPWFGTRHRQVLAPGAALPLDGILKISVADSGPGSVAVAGLPGLASLVHGTGDMDVVAEGVDKSIAVRALSDGSGADLALGNDRNDLQLLREAGTALVVGDGLSELDRSPHVERVAARPGDVARALDASTALLASA